jgi:hypothetical protein
MRERNAADFNLPAELMSVSDLHPREAVRALAAAARAVARAGRRRCHITIHIMW